MNHRKENSIKGCEGCGRKPCICKRFRKYTRKRLPAVLSSAKGKGWQEEALEDRDRKNAFDFRQQTLQITKEIEETFDPYYKVMEVLRLLTQ